MFDRSRGMDRCHLSPTAHIAGWPRKPVLCLLISLEALQRISRPCCALERSKNHWSTVDGVVLRLQAGEADRPDWEW